MGGSMAIKVLIADDHKIMREGLRSLLEKEDDIQVLAEAEDGRATLRLAKELEPDVILMDVAMPGLNGVEATRQVLAEVPSIKVIALSMHDDKRFVLNMFNAGACGYLLKDCAYKEVVQAIRGVMANKTYLSPEIAAVVVKKFVANSASVQSSAYVLLTPREREVLQLVAEGKTTNQIAARLYVSPKTIETHRQQIMQKLKLKSVAELTKYAVREGLTGI